MGSTSQAEAKEFFAEAEVRRELGDWRVLVVSVAVAKLSASSNEDWDSISRAVRHAQGGSVMSAINTIVNAIVVSVRKAAGMVGVDNAAGMLQLRGRRHQGHQCTRTYTRPWPTPSYGSKPKSLSDFGRDQRLERFERGISELQTGLSGC